MKHIATVALTCTFAAVLAAQQDASRRPKDPAVEIARAIAVEEQEGNLATAEQLYRKARVDRSLSEAARTLATTRLVQLLQRLGRVDEAKVLLRDLKGEVVSLDDVTNEQGAEREKELRANAREIILAMEIERANRTLGPGLVLDLPQLSTSQLLWIGSAAIPEIIAALQNREQFGQLNRTVDGLPVLQVGLLRLLWQMGGEQADAYLVACLADPAMAETCARASRYVSGLDGARRPVRALLEHDDDSVIRLAIDFGFDCDLESLVAAAERGRALLRTRVLILCSQRILDPELVPRLHELARLGLDSADPDWGSAAESFLCTSQSQTHVEGVRLLLRILPSLVARRQRIGAMLREPSSEEVIDLVPAIDDCVRRLGDQPTGVRISAVEWLHALMCRVVVGGGEPVIPNALAWWDAGFDMTPAMLGRVNESNAEAVFARRDKAQDARSFFDLFQYDGPLPQSLFDRLVALGKGQDSALNGAAIGRLVVRTGDPRAVGWLLARWRGADASDGPILNATSVASYLLWIAKSDRREPVRAALDEVLHGRGGALLDGEWRAQIVMAFLAMQDERGLAAFGEDVDVVAKHFTQHPFGPGQQQKSRNALQYLFDPEAEPAHGLTEDQKLAALQRYLAHEPPGLIQPDQVNVSWLSDRALVLLAEQEHVNYGGTTWETKVVRQLAIRLETGRDAPLLAQWLERTLAARQGVPWVLQALRDEPKLVARFESQLQAVLTGTNEDWAVKAAVTLWDNDRRLDLAAQLQSPFVYVRDIVMDILVEGGATLPIDRVLPLANDPVPRVRVQVARYCGARVAKEAVPVLISLLRDADNEVRTVASEALTRIRFYHEQQAHWDRVLQGMDASPGSACEKLLLQAKPDQPKAQRLLAIQSLGTLGVPEALPFLIEWTTGADAEITAAAKAAITAIHLSPRK